MRRLHSSTGLIAALIVMFMAVSGVVLSVQPALDTIAAHVSGPTGTVAELAGQVQAALPSVDRITRSASGEVVAYYRDGTSRQASRIDPSTGEVLGPYEPSAVMAFVTELHRSLFLGETGRAIAGLASVAIAILAVSGLVLLAARMGGWRNLFGRVRGSGAQRLHTTLARVAVLALMLTAGSGAFMSAVNFGFIPDGTSMSFALLPSGTGGQPAAVAALEGLAGTAQRDLRELAFPAAGDPGDVFTLIDNAGTAYVDQSTGETLSFTPNSVWQQVYELIYLVHTGQGAWWLGLILGAAALAVPAMAGSGAVIWLGRWRNRIRLRANASWRSAETVILVGSEGNTTQAFAATLHAALTAAGQRVHTAPMNGLRAYPAARRLLILTATYGDGHAPASARHFLARLARLRLNPALAYAVLGFGDRGFARYCAFADAVETALSERGLAALLPLGTIDRQSGRDFAEWGRHLGAVLGQPLALDHVPVRPRTRRLVLASRRDYGIEVQAPTAVLRFTAPVEPRTMPWPFGPRLPRFSVGDLVGIIPPGSAAPRYYSLASASRDGELEICVRKQTGGVCSEFLHGLNPGEAIDAFVRPNPDFHAPAGNRPLILIGAGSGIAPLAGVVRHNRRRRPIYMLFGARDPNSDFLYRDELGAALETGRLAALETAFSRIVGGCYVQDRVAANADLLRRLIADGAHIMVCGGRDMAGSVRSVIDDIVRPLGESALHLKSIGRYREDAY
jgi:sulfite reductase (NADPH) flavoprotein alpha-component